MDDFSPNLLLGFVIVLMVTVAIGVVAHCIWRMVR